MTLVSLLLLTDSQSVKPIFKRLFLLAHISKKHYILAYSQRWGGGWGLYSRFYGVCRDLYFDNFSLKKLQLKPLYSGCPVYGMSAIERCPVYGMSAIEKLGIDLLRKRVNSGFTFMCRVVSGCLKKKFPGFVVQGVSSQFV